MTTDNKSIKEMAAVRERRLDIQHLQMIEGNPLDEADIALFEMFEREGWSHEERRAYLHSQAASKSPQAAE